MRSGELSNRTPGSGADPTKAACPKAEGATNRLAAPITLKTENRQRPGRRPEADKNTERHINYAQ